ncbi:MAG: hypothetical protein ACLPZR_25790 [Solirubrobacteraceae bacterium]
MTSDDARRCPPDEQVGVRFAFDVGCLAPEQRALWDQYFAALELWAHGAVWEVTLVEFWSLDQMCSLEAISPPAYLPELDAKVSGLDRMLAECLVNVRTGPKTRRRGRGRGAR